jgi:hypothetical protein
MRGITRSHLLLLSLGCSPLMGCNVKTPDTSTLLAAEKSTKTIGSVQDLFGFADNAIRPGTTLVNNSPLADTASDIRDLLATQTGGCSNTQLSLNGAAVTADFGSGGCTMGEVTTTGSVTFEAVGIMPASVRMTGTNLNINGKTMDGSVTFSSSQPGSMDVALDVNNRGSQQEGTLNVRTDSLIPPGLTFDGEVTSTDGDGATNYKLNDVSWKVGDCYPSSGNVQVNDDVTVGFDDETKSSGKVSVNGENFEGSTNLPSYANCNP